MKRRLLMFGALIGLTFGGVQSAHAQEACDLAAATVDATVALESETVTFDVMASPACAGEALQVEAVPSSSGVSILKNVEVDAGGLASVTEGLFGSRLEPQTWDVELRDDTGAILATTQFEIAGLCVALTGTLEIAYSPADNTVDVLFTADDLACAGEPVLFLFSRVDEQAPPTEIVDGAGQASTVLSLDDHPAGIVAVEAIRTEIGGGGGLVIAEARFDPDAAAAGDGAAEPEQSETAAPPADTESSDGSTSAVVGVTIIVALVIVAGAGSWLWRRRRVAAP